MKKIIYLFLFVAAINVINSCKEDPEPEPPDTEKPKISIISPLDLTIPLTGTISIKAEATDNVGIAKMELFINEFSMTTSETSIIEFGWNTKTVDDGVIHIKIIAQDVSGNTEEKVIQVEVKNVVLTYVFFPNDIRHGKIITIVPSNGLDNNVYKFNGIQGKQKWTWPTPVGREIGVEIPSELPLGEVQIEITDSKGRLFVSADEGSLNIIPSGSWVQKNDFLHGATENATGFSIASTGYVVVADKIYQYEPITDAWMVSKSLTGTFNSVSAFVVDGRAYFINGNELWFFDPLSKDFNQKSNFPGLARDRSVLLTNNEFAYYGIGRGPFDPVDNSKDLLFDFWRYDTNMDKWLQLSDFPDKTITQDLFGVNLNNAGYIFGSSNWIFNFTTETFVKAETNLYPTSVSSVAMFVIGNKLYQGVNGPGFVEYDPIEDRSLLDTNFPGASRFNVFTFVIDNVAYVGAGRGTGGIFLKDVWAFTPAN